MTSSVFAICKLGRSKVFGKNLLSRFNMNLKPVLLYFALSKSENKKKQISIQLNYPKLMGFCWKKMCHTAKAGARKSLNELAYRRTENKVPLLRPCAVCPFAIRTLGLRTGSFCPPLVLSHFLRTHSAALRALRTRHSSW